MAAFCFFDNALDAAVAPTTLFAAACSANRDLQSEAVGFAASAAASFACRMAALEIGASESLLEDSSRLLGAHTAVAASCVPHQDSSQGSQAGKR